MLRIAGIGYASVHMMLAIAAAAVLTQTWTDGLLSYERAKVSAAYMIPRESLNHGNTTLDEVIHKGRPMTDAEVQFYCLGQGPARSEQDVPLLILPRGHRTIVRWEASQIPTDAVLMLWRNDGLMSQAVRPSFALEHGQAWQFITSSDYAKGKCAIALFDASPKAPKTIFDRVDLGIVPDGIELFDDLWAQAEAVNYREHDYLLNVDSTEHLKGHFDAPVDTKNASPIWHQYIFYSGNQKPLASLRQMSTFRHLRVQTAEVPHAVDENFAPAGTLITSDTITDNFPIVPRYDLAREAMRMPANVPIGMRIIDSDAKSVTVEAVFGEDDPLPLYGRSFQTEVISLNGPYARFTVTVKDVSYALGPFFETPVGGGLITPDHGQTPFHVDWTYVTDGVLRLKITADRHPFQGILNAYYEQRDISLRGKPIRFAVP